MRVERRATLQSREKIGVSRKPFRIPVECLSVLYPSLHDEDSLRADLAEAADSLRREAQHSYNQVRLCCAASALWECL